MGHPSPVLEFTGQDPDAMQDNLTTAVHAASEQAMLVGGYGIMITSTSMICLATYQPPEAKREAQATFSHHGATATLDR